MSSYKLTYFNFPGLGEPVRFLLSYGGVKFEDFRITFDEWPQLKPKMPMEQMPVLEIDGKTYFQTRAICRYLAKKFDLYSSDDLVALQIDCMADTVDDIRIPLANFFREQNPEYKAQLKEIAIDKAHSILKKLEQFAKNNGGYLATNKLTWADLYFSALSETFSSFLGLDISKDYPILKKLDDNVRKNPNVKAYLEKRPASML